MCSLYLHNTPESTPSSNELADESGVSSQGDMALNLTTLIRGSQTIFSACTLVRSCTSVRRAEFTSAQCGLCRSTSSILASSVQFFFPDALRGGGRSADEHDGKRHRAEKGKAGVLY
jgi:hypothetical protein